MKKTILLKTNKFIIYASNGFIVRQSIVIRCEHRILVTKLNKLKKFILVDRLLRVSVFTIIALTDNIFFLNIYGAIFKITLEPFSVIRITALDIKYKVLNFGLISNGEEIRYLVFSNYSSNLNKKPVYLEVYDICEMKFESKFIIFDEGVANHVHSFVESDLENEILINVGDDDFSVGLWRCNIVSRELNPVLVGNQLYRSVFCYKNKFDNNIYFFGDNPAGKNYIFKYSIDNPNQPPTNICEINGPVIYGVMAGSDTIVFSTSAEPVKKISYLDYMKIFTFDLSYSTIYKFEIRKQKISIIKKFKKDIFGYTLFGLGGITFPLHIEAGNEIFYNVQSISGRSGLIYESFILDE